MIKMAHERLEYLGEILARNDSNENVQLEADSITESLKTITTDHSDIHNKKGFSFSAAFTGVLDAATKALAFKTPSLASGKIIHLVHRDFHATANKIRADFYEGLDADPTFGSDLPIFNHNRTGTIPESAMQAVKFGIDVVLTGGTMIETSMFANINSRNIEWVLKPNTWYVRTFTNLTGAAADIDIYEFWIEE
jgi:hypothetical protein